MRKYMLLVAATLIIGLLTPGAPGAEDDSEKDALRAQIAELQEDVELLQSIVGHLAVRAPMSSTALDCDGGTFAEMVPKRSNLVLLVACEDIEPYLEGHRVKVSVGNPYQADILGLTGSLGYGPDIATAVVQTKEFSETDTLRAGTWTTIEVVVNPSKASEMRVLDLSLEIGTVSMKRSLP